MSRKVSLSLSAVLTLSLTVASCAFADSEFEQGKQEYKSGNFGQARQLLESVLAKEPKNADAHYLLGNTYLELQRSAQASAHYRQAQLLDPNGSAGQYSGKALEAMSKMNQQALASRNAARSLPGLGGPTPAPPSRRSEKIEEETTRLNEQCDKEVAEIKRQADDKMKRLKEDMQSRIDANGKARYGRRGVAYYDPTDANNEIKTEIQPQLDQITRDSERRINELKALYKQKVESARGH